MPSLTAGRESVPPAPQKMVSRAAAAPGGRAAFTTLPAPKPTSPREGLRTVPTYRYDVLVPAKRQVESAPPDPQIAVEEELGKLDASGLLFRCPTEMTLGTAVTVTFSTREGLNALLERQLQARGFNTGQVDTSVEALLFPDKDGAFEIVAQHASAGTGWAWKVSPKELGRHTLNLKVRFIATLVEKPHERVFPPLSQPVSVKPDAVHQLAGVLRGQWRWLAPIAVLAVFLAWMRHRTRVAA